MPCSESHFKPDSTRYNPINAMYIYSKITFTPCDRGLALKTLSKSGFVLNIKLLPAQIWN